MGSKVGNAVSGAAVVVALLSLSACAPLGGSSAATMGKRTASEGYLVCTGGRASRLPARRGIDQTCRMGFAGSSGR